MVNTPDFEKNQKLRIIKSKGTYTKILLVLLVSVCMLLALGFITLSVIKNETRFFILAAGFLLSTLFGFLAISDLWKIPHGARVIIFSIFFEISLAVLAGVFPAYLNIPYIAICISISFILAAYINTSLVSDWVISIGVIGAITAFQLRTLVILPQTTNISISIAILAISILIVGVVIGLFLTKSFTTTLRIKLIFGSLTLLLIPLAVLSFLNNRFLQNAIQEQSNQSLRVAAEQTALLVDDFIKGTSSALEYESSLPVIVRYVSLDPSNRPLSVTESDLQDTLLTLQSKEKAFPPSYGVLDLTGKNIFDTNPQNANVDESSTVYFLNSSVFNKGYASAIEFNSGDDVAKIHFINPIKNSNGKTIGYLRVTYDAGILQDLVTNNIGLIGNHSYPILLDNNGLRLADGISPAGVYRSIRDFSENEYSELTRKKAIPLNLSKEELVQAEESISKALESPVPVTYFTTPLKIDEGDVLHAGVMVSLTYEPWSVAYLKDQSSLTESLKRQNRLSSILATLMAGIVGILATLISNLITTPLLRLTKAAQNISAGDFSIQTKITSNDEIGVLGEAFNKMTKQVKDSIDTLENRVKERTLEYSSQNESLHLRTRQLQTVAEVARNIVSSRDVDTLLNSVSNLISERFGFYHVGVFLLDEKNEYAFLRASNSQGGKRMLERKHKLAVGQTSMVGYVTSTGNPRIATDVGLDAVFFNNPDLPDTKSEMTLPLKLGERVFGALDVQSTDSNAFSEEDVDLFATLADQIAVAIDNNQLFAETSRSLEETRELYKRYLRQEWTHQNKDSGNISYKFTADGLVRLEEDLPEIEISLRTAKTIFTSQKSHNDAEEITSIMAVPIMLRDESIGVIHLRETGSRQYSWSQNEILTVQSVADQISQILENARLFEQTIRRADREKKVLEITSKIRSTNDPQKMLQITLEELSKNLGASKAQIVINVSDQSLQKMRLEN